MSRALRAGGVYALAVFAIGFVLGTARVLLVAPRIGEFAAVAIEVPVMLAIAWPICARIVRSFALGRGSERAAMGVSAFVLLMALEWALALLLFRRSVAQMIGGYGTAAGLLGLAGQVGFALLPFLQRPANVLRNFAVRVGHRIRRRVTCPAPDDRDGGGR